MHKSQLCDVVRFARIAIVLSFFIAILFLGRGCVQSSEDETRCIANISDDLSIELVAVTYFTGQSAPYVDWWSPSGTARSDIVEDDLAIRFPDPQRERFIFLFGVSDGAMNRKIDVRAASVPVKNFPATSPTADGQRVRVITDGSVGFMSTASVAIEVSTKGWTEVGELTVVNPSLHSTAGNTVAEIDVVNSPPDFSIGKKYSWCVRISEDENAKTSWRVDAFRDTQVVEKPFVMSTEYVRGRRYTYYLTNTAKWSHVKVHQCTYDLRLQFDKIATKKGTKTYPAVSFKDTAL